MTNGVTSNGGRSRALSAYASFGGLLLLLALLAWLRGHPDAIDGLYNAGDVLETHKASGLTIHVFGTSLAHIQLLLLVLLLLGAVGILPSARRTAFAWGAAVVAFAFVYADSAARYTGRIGGRLYYWMCDDALISFRYARNFAEGRGLVYNVGEHVDGFTNPLWTAFMVIPHALGLHEGVAPIPVIVLGGVLLAVMAACSRLVLEEASVPLAIQLAAAFVMVFDVSLFDFSVAGLETPLMAAGTALVMTGGLTRRERWIGLGIVLLTLARADGAVVSTLLMAWLLIEEAATTGDSLVTVAKRRWKRLGLLVGVAALLVGWRYALYGYPAPNTYYLKVYSLRERVLAGVASYGVRGLLWYGLPSAFVLWVSFTTEGAGRARRLLIPVVGMWLYVMYIGGDAFALLRFLAPVAAPMLWTAVGLAIAARWPVLERGMTELCVALIVVVSPIESERGVLGSTWDRSNAVREWVITAKTMEQNTPPDASIATFFAGMPYYAPGRRFVDVLGKVEAHIAHQKTIHGVSPGHNKYDFAYVYGERKPDVTFTPWSCDEVDRWMHFTPEEFARETSKVRPETYQAPYDQLRDPAFRELYYPKRVVLRDGDGPAGHMLGCWFIRTDSKVPVVWQIAHP